MIFVTTHLRLPRSFSLFYIIIDFSTDLSVSLMYTAQRYKHFILRKSVEQTDADWLNVFTKTHDKWQIVKFAKI